MIITDKFSWIPSPDLLLAVFGGLCLIIMGIEAFRHKRPLKTVLAGSCSGVLALAACHFWGGAVGIYLPFTVLHLAVALVLGVPGVLLMLGAAAIG